MYLVTRLRPTGYGGQASAATLDEMTLSLDPVQMTRIRTAAEARQAMRRSEWTGMTVHQLPGYVQCNLVMLPKTHLRLAFTPPAFAL